MAEEIIMELVEAIRKRPAMYMGSTSNRGFVNLFRDSIIHVFNRLDCRKFSVELLGGLRAKFEIIIIEQKVSDSFVNNVWKDAPSFHGTDMVVLNALSKSFQFRLSDKNGKNLLEQEYKKGKIVKGEITEEKFVTHKIEITFDLDDSIFEIDKKLNPNFLMNELEKFAYLNKGRKLEIKYKVGTENCRVIFQFENGLEDLIEVVRLKGLLGTYFDTHFEQQFDGFSVECAFAFRETPVDETFLSSFVNSEHTHENGTHIDGLLKGITYGVMKHFQKHELTQKYKISEKGIMDELVAAIHIKMKQPQFSGCVKNKLASPEIIEPISEYVSELLFQKIENDEESKDKLIRKFAI